MSEILIIALSAVASGVQTIYEIEEFGKIKENWFKNDVGLLLKNGIPSHDTIGRVLQIIDPKKFQSLFIQWMEEVMELPRGSSVHIDGKTVCGSGCGEQKGFHSGQCLCT